MTLAEDLRDAVLKAAIHGKLSEQFLTDTPVGDTIPHLKRLAVADDLYSDIPETWMQITISNLSHGIDAGKSPDCARIPVTGKEWGVITTTAIQWGAFDQAQNKRLPDGFAILDKWIIREGDVLITRAGPMKRTGVACVVKDIDKNLILSDKTLRLRTDCINKDFLVICLQSPETRRQVFGIMNGMDKQQVNISQKNIAKVVIPVPPIEEQCRIVNRVGQLMAQIDEYEKMESELTSLKEAFPSDMRTAILQAAMQGKLTAQLETDGSVEELLSHIQLEKDAMIKAGKLKKSKKSAPILGDTPFEIPDNWRWVTLPVIAESSLGKTLNKATDKGEEKPYLCSINVYASGINLDVVKTARFSVFDMEKYRLKKNDLLICEGGDAGRSCVWNNSEEMYYQNALHRVRFFGGNNPYFYHYVMLLYKSNGVIADHRKGETIQHLVQSKLYSMPLPLPPIEEQQRIVERLDALLPLCDELLSDT